MQTHLQNLTYGLRRYRSQGCTDVEATDRDVRPGERSVKRSAAARLAVAGRGRGEGRCTGSFLITGPIKFRGLQRYYR